MQHFAKSTKSGLAILACAALFTVSLSAAETFDFRKGFSGVAAKATPAVVFIKVEKQVPMGNMQHYFNNPFDLFGEEFAERFFGVPRGNRPGGQQAPNRRPRQQSYRQTGQGSGFIISKDGYILTNTHVVGDVDKITVKLGDGREFIAKRIGADPKTEVALIKIEAEGDLPSLPIGDPKKLLTGEWVIAIGNPFGLKETLTVGVVSAKERTGIGIADYEEFIQTDAAINPGNSGGPLLNIDGEVIGINTAIYSRSGGYMGIGFAVPIDMAMNIKEQLVVSGRVTRGYIGVAMNPGGVTEELAKAFGRDEAGGVLIAEVVKDGPADKAGIKSGDILTALNGNPIKDNFTFRNDVARILPNSKAVLTLFRDGKAKKVTVTVGTLADDDGDTDAAESDTEMLSELGFQVQELTREVAQELGIEDATGVVVAEVAEGSEAAERGLRPGMVVTEVNRQTIKNLKDFERALKRGGKGTVLLRLRTKQGSIFIHLTT